MSATAAAETKKEEGRAKGESQLQKQKERQERKERQKQNGRQQQKGRPKNKNEMILSVTHRTPPRQIGLVRCIAACTSKECGSDAENKHVFLELPPESKQWKPAGKVAHIVPFLPYTVAKAFTDEFLRTSAGFKQLESLIAQKWLAQHYGDRFEEDTKLENGTSKAIRDEAATMHVTSLRFFALVVWAAFCLKCDGVIVQPNGRGNLKGIWIDTSCGFAPEEQNLMGDAPFLDEWIFSVGEYDLSYTSFVLPKEFDLAVHRCAVTLKKLRIKHFSLAELHLGIWCRTSKGHAMVVAALDSLTMHGSLKKAAKLWPCILLKSLAEEIVFLGKELTKPFDRIMVAVYWSFFNNESTGYGMLVYPILATRFEEDLKKWEEIAKDFPEQRGSIGYCTVCNSPTEQRCAQCGVAPYCSRQCQQLDWSRHKEKECFCRQRRNET